MRKFFPLAFIIPAVFFLDRISKNFIVNAYPEGGGFPVWRGVFHITRVNNTGAAFGILRGAGGPLVWIAVVSVILLSCGLFLNVLRGPGGPVWRPGLQETAWALVIAGAAGNLYDRLWFGYVIDFLDFRVWPVFNLADSSICVGAILVLVVFWRSRPSHGEN